ncbi:hypothetical protein [Paenibacillus faecalis]|uniref:hypothetical protein n=1 Tax=Paenibacillus faecalis TaxID=2079532 RepID=UPI000D1054D6|nr:hypothetical protein [Paenibacillus faecalis]
MKTYWKVSLAAMAIGAGIWIGSVYNSTAMGAGTASPGTTDDPVVTKSYVDEQIQKALGGGTGTKPSEPSTPTKPSQPSQGADEVKVVKLNPGKVLIADAGTEVIVRSGNAVIYTQDADGVANLTEGKDLLNGQPAPKNHLLSFPREGRGVTVKEGQKSSLVLMVRGGYQIK